MIEIDIRLHVSIQRIMYIAGLYAGDRLAKKKTSLAGSHAHSNVR